MAMFKFLQKMMVVSNSSNTIDGRHTYKGEDARKWAKRAQEGCKHAYDEPEAKVIAETLKAMDEEE
mgnify:CR=1 FL=1